eukprot:Pgem_evm1s18703
MFMISAIAVSAIMASTASASYNQREVNSWQCKSNKNYKGRHSNVGYDCNDYCFNGNSDPKVYPSPGCWYEDITKGYKHDKQCVCVNSYSEPEPQYPEPTCSKELKRRKCKQAGGKFKYVRHGYRKKGQCNCPSEYPEPEPEPEPEYELVCSKVLRRRKCKKAGGKFKHVKLGYKKIGYCNCPAVYPEPEPEYPEPEPEYPEPEPEYPEPEPEYPEPEYPEPEPEYPEPEPEYPEPEPEYPEPEPEYPEPEPEYPEPEPEYPEPEYPVPEPEYPAPTCSKWLGKENCETLNGVYGHHGLLGEVYCNCPTSDSGESCSSSTDCESNTCLCDKTSWGSYGKSHGKCAPYKANFGCYGVVTHFNGHSQCNMLCVD